jgi:hypothetical protein
MGTSLWLDRDENSYLGSNEKYRNIRKFVILKIKFTDRVFNGTKIKLNLFESLLGGQKFKKGHP